VHAFHPLSFHLSLNAFQPFVCLTRHAKFVKLHLFTCLLGLLPLFLDAGSDCSLNRLNAMRVNRSVNRRLNDRAEGVKGKVAFLCLVEIIENLIAVSPSQQYLHV
jgi:hypothetical protein